MVYGGGGINPDVYVPYDTAKVSTAVLDLVFSDKVKTTVWNYYFRNRTALKAYSGVQDFDKNFRAEVLLKEYLATVDRPTKKVVEILLKNEHNKRFFTRQMKAVLARMLYRDDGYYSIIYKDDDVVRKAIQILNSVSYSDIISR